MHDKCTCTWVVLKIRAYFCCVGPLFSLVLVFLPYLFFYLFPFYKIQTFIFLIVVFQDLVMTFCLIQNYVIMKGWYILLYRRINLQFSCVLINSEIELFRFASASTPSKVLKKCSKWKPTNLIWLCLEEYQHVPALLAGEHLFLVTECCLMMPLAEQKIHKKTHVLLWQSFNNVSIYSLHLSIYQV